jgi:DNA-binding MarR family transcriptional regulator
MRTRRSGAPAEGPPEARRKVQAILAENPIPHGFRLGYIANLFSGPIYKQMSARHGIGRPEWIVLFCLAGTDRVSANDVSPMSGRAKANVSRAVHKLLRLGLVSRMKDPNDARSAFLGLTRKGAEIYEATLPLFVEREAAMLAPLTLREIAQLDRLLGRLTLRDDGWDVTY